MGGKSKGSQKQSVGNDNVVTAKMALDEARAVLKNLKEQRKTKDPAIAELREAIKAKRERIHELRAELAGLLEGIRAAKAAIAEKRGATVGKAELREAKINVLKAELAFQKVCQG